MVLRQELYWPESAKVPVAEQETAPDTFRRQNAGADCIVQTPEEYMQLAVALGTSEDRRRNMQRAIRDASPVLLEREAAARAVEDFFAQAAVSERRIHEC